MPEDTLDIVVRLRNGRVAAAEARAVAEEVEHIDRAQTRAAVSSGRFSRASGSMLSGMGSLVARGTQLVGTFGAMAVAAGAFVGLKFDATMESNTVAFKNFLGTEKAARKELDYLYRLAATTPFEFPDLVSGARRLLAFGMNAKEANRWLGTIGDTVAGIGGGTDEIDRMVIAIGQIQAKGKLSTEELQQLAELGIPAFQAVAKGTGRSMSELFADLQAGTITAAEALPALQKALQKTFAGSTAAQAKTFTGQLSTLKDNATAALGALSKPLFDLLRSQVFPRLNKALGGVASYLRTGGLKQSIRALTAGFSGSATAGATGFAGTLQKVGGVARSVFDLVKRAFAIGKGAVQDFMDAIKPMQPFIQNVIAPLLQGVLIGVIFGVVGAFKLLIGVLRVVSVVLGFLGQHAKPLRPIFVGIGAVLGFLITGPLLGTIKIGGRLGTVLQAVGKVARWLGGQFKAGGEVIVGAFGRVGSAIGRVASGITGRLRSIVDFVVGMPAKIASAAANLWEPLKSGLVGSLNWIIGKLNWLIRQVNHIPGVSIGAIGAIMDPSTIIAGQAGSVGGGTFSAAPAAPAARRGGGGSAVAADPRRGERAVISSVPRPARDRVLQPVHWNIDGRKIAEIMVDVSDAQRGIG